MTLSVRTALPTDVEVIFDIRTSVKENHLSLEQLAQRGITHSSVREAIVATRCAWIAEDDGQPAGFSMANAGDGSVFAVFVRPEFSGQGVGRTVLAKVEAFLFDHHKKIWLETDASTRAYGFYCHLGWRPVEYFSSGDVRFEKSR